MVDMKRIKYILIISLVFIFALACSKSSSSDDDGGGDNYDRVVLTTSWVDNLVSPAINDFKTKVETLNTSVIAFTDAPDETHLATVRTNLFEAAKTWQHVEMFFNGSSYALDIYSYPTDETRILDNINSDIELNLSRTVLNSSQGLPAIDYLINGLEATDEAILAKYEEADYIDYLKTLSARIVALTTETIVDFDSTKAMNIESTGNDSSSYFSMQINDYIEYIEKSFREQKIATPSGTRNRSVELTIFPSPNSVESLYSPNNSKALYLEAYDAIQDFYYGRSYTNDTNIEGLQNYIQFLGTTILVDESDILLDTYVEQLFDDIDAANANLTDNFFNQTQDYNTNFDAVFDAIQEYVITNKNNIVGAFNIIISFEDNDND